MPKSKQDPTGQARNRRLANRALVVRIRQARNEVVRIVKAIPNQRVTVNQQSFSYTYDFNQLQEQITQAIAETILETTGVALPADWYFSQYVENPFRQGIVESVRDVNRLLEQAGIASGQRFFSEISTDSVLFSQRYADAFTKTNGQSWVAIKGMNDRTTSQVLHTVVDSLDAGLSKTKISQLIKERFDVAESSANRIAQTEVNRAFTDGKLDGADITSEQTDSNVGVIHISALLLTTRDSHAARHLGKYTTVQQRQWWAQGSNRINCHCSVEPVLLD